ncbi:MAG TPA: SpoVG family protein [bacterium]|nr:SpoVG family protein [bacterium]
MNFKELFTSVRIMPAEMKNLKAFAEVTIANHFVCKGFKIMDGAKGLWVSMPSRSSKNGQWEDIFHPITAEGRAQLFDIILKSYEEFMATKNTSKSDEDSKSEIVKQSKGKQKEETIDEPTDDLPPEDEIPF